MYIHVHPKVQNIQISVAARSKAWVCGRSFAGNGAWLSVSCECLVLSSTSFCVGLIARPESYPVSCV
jgi:hypothetical protein